MRKMKNSEIEWIGLIPSDWQILRNKYNFDLVKDIIGAKCNEAQLLSLTKNGIKAITEEQQTGKVPASFATYQIVKENDIVMCLFDLDVSAVFSGISGYDGMISPAYKCLKCKPHCYPKYIDYYFMTVFVDRKYKRYSKNVRYSLSADEFMALSIIVPPLKEQKAIADFLDKKCSEIDSLTKDIEKQIEVLEDYKKSVITEAVTKGLNPNVEMKDSEVECVGVISTNRIVTKLKYVLSEPMKYGASESGVDYNADLPRYIRITDITLDGILKEDGKLSLTNEQAQGYILKDNTILFARSGATVGKTFMYNKDYGKSAFAGYLISGVPNKSIVNPKWVYYCVNSSYYWDWCNRIFNQATIQNIGADKYSNFPLVIVSYEEQNEIVNYLDKALGDIDSILSDKKKQLEILADYKKSLIYEYVTGKKEVIA